MEDLIVNLKFKELSIQESIKEDEGVKDMELEHEIKVKDDNYDYDYEVSLPRVTCWISDNGKVVHGVVVIDRDKKKKKKKKMKELIREQHRYCRICFNPFSHDGSHQICYLPCGHIFGLSCMKMFFQIEGRSFSQKCPTCRKSCTMKDVELLYHTRLRNAVADQKISRTRFPFTKKGSRAFKLYVLRQLTDALKRQDDALKRRYDALKRLADVRRRQIDLLKRCDDIAFEGQPNALECPAEALEWQAETLKQRVEALGQQVDAFKESIDFFERRCKEHMARVGATKQPL